MQLPSLNGADFAAAATQFNQEKVSANLEIELLRKSIEISKEQSQSLLGLLNPQHLGQHFDGKA